MGGDELEGDMDVGVSYSGEKREEDYIAWIKDKLYRKVRDFSSFALFFLPIIS